jgi:hypothetical protein
MGCYLEDYRARVGTWAGRFSWRGVAWRGVAWRGVAWRGVAWRVVSKLSDAIGTTGECLGFTMVSSMILVVLLIIGGIEQNPGPIAEVKNIVRILCTGCAGNQNSGIQCEMCGRWYHYSCGNVKAQTVERENWSSKKCRMEKVRVLEEKLQNALRQIDELKVRNRDLEAKLQMAGSGERDTMPTKQKLKCVWW